MREHSEVLNVLLSHSRGLLDEKAQEANDGYQVYVFILEKVDIIIEAKLSSSISYTYFIKSYERKYKRYSSTPHPLTKSSHVHIPPPPSLPTRVSMVHSSITDLKIKKSDK